jgi:hypothetical protein
MYTYVNISYKNTLAHKYIAEWSTLNDKPLVGLVQTEIF